MTSPKTAPPSPASPTTSAKGESGSEAVRPLDRGGGAVPFGVATALRSWRVLAFILLVQLALGVTVVLPFWSAIAPHLDHHPHAGVLAGAEPDAYERALGWEAGMDPGIWRDVKRETKGVFEGVGIVHFWIAVVAWLFGALVAGGILGTAATGDRPVRVGRFLAVGAKNYGRMLRVGLVFAIAYYVTARLVFEAWAKSVEPTEFMDPSEEAGWLGDRLREGAFVVLFLWFRVAADLARAELAVFGRSSAVLGFLRGLGGALRPRVFGTALAIGLPAFALLLGLSFAAHELVGDHWLTLVLLFLLFEVAVLVRWGSRTAVLAGFTRLVRPPRRG